MITIHNLRKNFGTQTAVDIENYTINQERWSAWWVTMEPEKQLCSV